MPWTTPKTWSSGETLTAANFNTHIRDNGDATWHLIARKTTDESVTSSGVLQNDDQLLWSVAANEIWIARMYLLFTAATAGDINVSWGFPASGVLYASAPGSLDAAGAVVSPLSKLTATDGTSINFFGDAPEKLFMEDVLYINAGNAGT